jgi:hypothetical protein
MTTPDAEREALRQMIYETTHLSACESDGSHWCKISGEALAKARAAYAATPSDDEAVRLLHLARHTFITRGPLQEEIDAYLAKVGK